ncbi:hypothetical protein F7725_020940 [Dissostichus mawsoni]|uniref:Uncharacterized protein n=1 Tax=Dissostichus mawsoni TaxID=36200 RepID=A0A7J5YEL7_DISMA|nr:hypothetical protein F7725_020940 [Dissostichus mawsoni]
MKKDKRRRRKRQEGRGKRVQEKMKENEHKSAQRNTSTELCPPGSKEKAQREGKGRKREKT